ncbi:RelA/SpoT family protein [Oceanicella actignis]|uniref:RelA/SpoT family protein n=1 Tax=Oceanicella actignis TaxID=1189325 RepID=UPI00125C13E7|nr:GTP pyrophosphokinase [Oceanicella actignis]
MIRPHELVERIRAYNPNTDEALLNAAYVFGARAHAGQFRKSGEPYWNHPVEVANILAELHLDDATIVTALLHDTVEDTPATHEELRELFGEEIAQLVDGVTKLTKLQLSSAEAEQAENLRKLLLAMSKDVRVLLVKLADRLHNMRTIAHMPPHKQEQKARETMEIYAPLAGRMGMQSMREELEDLAFRVLNPDARRSIMRRFVQLKKETGDLIPQITEDIRAALAAEGVSAQVTGREKRPYSIWRKMQEKGEEFSRLSDIYGFRIITETESDCYRALGAVHRRWRAVPGRFKDYISQPKSNGYRSIHTTVSGRDAKRVEVQIRTRQMHEVAESGIAAHWSYKDGARVDNPFAADPFQWLRNLTESFEQAENPNEFLEHVKLEMFQDQVFCFTPKGKVIKLPRGATPIDFAYAIHTRIGDSCVGAKIDGRRAPLWTKLRNGQTVEIIRADAQRPQPVWEQMVVTGRAKQAIRRALRTEQRAAEIRMGREIARQAFERAGQELSDKALSTAARLMGFASRDDLLQALGAADVTGAQVVAALFPAAAGQAPPAPAQGEGPGVIGVSRAHKVRFGPCCAPVPGDRIVGIARKGKGVTVHAIDCPILAAYEDKPELWLDLRWDERAAQAHQTSISLTFAHERGALARVCAVIAEMNADIVQLEFNDRKPDFYRARIDLEVRDVKHVSQIVTMLDAQPIVTEVRRIMPALLDPAGFADEGPGPEAAADEGAAARTRDAAPRGAAENGAQRTAGADGAGGADGGDGGAEGRGGADRASAAGGKGGAAPETGAAADRARGADDDCGEGGGEGVAAPEDRAPGAQRRGGAGGAAPETGAAEARPASGAEAENDMAGLFKTGPLRTHGPESG